MYDRVLAAFVNPTTYIFLFLIYISIRHVVWMLIPHLLSFLTFTLFYTIYIHVKAQYLQEQNYYPSKFFLNQRENLKQFKYKARPVLQYTLAQKVFWERSRESAKRPQTLSLSKVVRNHAIEELMNEIVLFIKRDFIQNWYKNSISSDEDFPNHVHFLLNYAISELHTRMERVDYSQLILIKICGLITNHAREYQNAERLLRASRVSNKLNKEELERLLPQHYMQGKLHPALSATGSDTSELELNYLRKKFKPLIPLLIPRKDSSSKVGQVLLREILVTCLIGPIMNMFADPDYWNQTLDILGNYLLENHVPTPLLRKSSEYTGDNFDFFSGRQKLPTLEEFIRQIGRCDNIPDTQKIRDTLLSEIDCRKREIAGYTPEEIVNGETVSNVEMYISGLEIALEKAQKHISKLQSKQKKALKADNVEINLSTVLEDLAMANVFEDYLENLGRDYLLHLWRFVVDFRDEFRIEWPITSLNDEIEPSAWESWNWVTIALRIQNAWDTFFAPNSNMNIADFITPSTISNIEAYVKSTKEKLKMNTLPDKVAFNGIKSFLLTETEIYNIFKTEDFPAFLKHPMGQKLLNKKESTLQRFLKSRSPDREPKNSSENERHLTSENDEADHETSGRSLMEMFRRRGSKGNLPKISWNEEKDVEYEVGNAMEGELNQIINTDESFYRKALPSSPKVDLRFQEDLLKSPSVSTMGDEGERSPFLKTFLKKNRGHERDRSKPTSSTEASPRSIAPELPDIEKDAEKIYNLELNDVAPSPIDENLDVPETPMASQPMIILPKKYFELDKELAVLQKDLDDVDAQLKEGKGTTDKTLIYSRRGIWDEIQDIREEKQSIEKLEIENALRPGKVTVSIGPNQVITQNGSNFSVYPLVIYRKNAEGAVSGWTIYRRYSQFLTLHQDLKAKFPTLMHNYDLPGKFLSGIMKKRSTFLESRREALEKYLNLLLEHSEVCQFEVFRRFLCHPAIIRLLYGTKLQESPVKRSFMSNVIMTVDDSINSIKSKGNKNAITLNPREPAVFSHNSVSPDLHDETQGEIPTSLTEPLIDLFIEIFELKGLRRQAVVLFLNQLFGDTVERKVTESLRELLSDSQIIYVMTSVRDSFWPNGEWSTKSDQRTDEQKSRSALDASSKLNTVLPDLLGGVVGRQNAKRGAVRICLFLQNRRLNQHLMYKILDEIIAVLFPK